MDGEEDAEKSESNMGYLSPSVTGMRNWEEIQNSLVAMTEVTYIKLHFKNEIDGDQV